MKKAGELPEWGLLGETNETGLQFRVFTARGKVTMTVALPPELAVCDALAPREEVS